MLEEGSRHSKWHDTESLELERVYGADSSHQRERRETDKLANLASVGTGVGDALVDAVMHLQSE